jgi:hypothetical protein
MRSPFLLRLPNDREEVSVSLNFFRAPASVQIASRRRRIAYAVLPAAILTAVLTVAGFAQMSQPPGPPRPLVSPEANRMPDKNEQMLMREQNLQKRNFDAANAIRLKQMMQASEALETLAMALKAQVDKPDSLSLNELNKAETIEKLARMVKERMKLTVAAN